jgi:hypothetical protein
MSHLIIYNYLERPLKKTLLYTLLLCSTAISAHPDQFKIDISNGGTANCILKQKTILSGYVSDSSAVATLIRPDETATFFMRSGTAHPLGNGLIWVVSSSIKDKIILLTYSCGANQEITLFTDQGVFDISQRVSGKVLDAQIIYAKFTTRTPFWLANDSPEIHWTLLY